MSSFVLTRPVGAGAAGIGEVLVLFSENPSAPTLPAALGLNSIAVGSGATSAADFSMAFGEQALSRIRGSIVQASGRFASSGDAQVGRYLLKTITVTSVFTEALIAIPNTRLVLQDNSTWAFKIMATAHRTDVGDGHAGYEFSGVIYRDSGAATVAFQGNPVKTTIAESNSAWDINITPDPSFGGLRVSVRGEAGKTIRWLIFVETVEITN